MSPLGHYLRTGRFACPESLLGGSGSGSGRGEGGDGRDDDDGNALMRSADYSAKRSAAGALFAAFLAFYGFPQSAALRRLLLTAAAADASSSSSSSSSSDASSETKVTRKSRAKTPSIARMARAMPGTSMEVLLAVRRELLAASAAP